MRVSVVRILVATVASLVWLAGCETSSKLGDMLGRGDGGPDTTGSILSTDGSAPGLLGGEPYDDLSLGKKQFRAGNYGLAERYFRKAVELHPQDVEAWVGLAASYDRLRRFDLADRAYIQAIGLVGQTPEILNNQGFSYMLRGDFARAQKTLLDAQARDPDSPHITANLALLDESIRKRKGIE
jgi:Flp pilus assembly protein TadD